LTKYPRSASSLFQAYNDIVYGKLGGFHDFLHLDSTMPAQQWTEVKVLNLESCARGAITGKKKNTVPTNPFLIFFPLESMSLLG
jgi:tRNA-splicing endonuclease subunit Sen15, fungi type